MNLFSSVLRARSFVVLALSLIPFVATRGDVVSAWNEALVEFSTVRARSLEPHLEARAYAMTHLAIDEAIALASREARAVGDDALQFAAAATAAEAVLVRVLPSGAARFKALAAAQLAEIGSGPDKTRGVALGREAADRVLRRRETDNWTLLPSELSTRDRAGPAALAQVIRHGEPRSPWEAATPFVLKKVGQVGAQSLHWITFEGTVEITQSLVRARIFDAVDRSALDELTGFWSEGPIVTWNRVARAVSGNAGHALATRARMFAVLNLALADATLASLHWQFTYGSWRRNFGSTWRLTEGMPARPADRMAQLGPGSLEIQGATNQILLPPTTNFPALAATVAGAAQATLSRFAVADRTPLAVPLPLGSRVGAARGMERQFTSLTSAARECAFATSLDGRHSKEACVSGYNFGVSIGDYVVKRANASSRTAAR